MSSASRSARRESAALAARMMAEEGVTDYGFAKRRAARRLGFPENGGCLPDNAEIEAELRVWQSLFQDDEQRQRLHAMRAAALELMAHLDEFDPWLTGGALDGTAGRYSELDIELYPQESAKEVEIFLLNLGLQPEHREPRRLTTPPVPEAILSFDWQDVPVRLCIYPARTRNQGKRRSERARRAAVEALLLQSQMPL